MISSPHRLPAVHLRAAATADALYMAPDSAWPLIPLRDVAGEIDSREFASTPNGHHGTWKFKVVEAANRKANFVGK
jgi:hypothetical protein